MQSKTLAAIAMAGVASTLAPAALAQLVLEEVPVPEPGVGEVLVRVRSCGFCATDYKAIRGIRRNVTFPLIPGHEPAGVVAAVGTGVTNFCEGDAVAVQPSGFCRFSISSIGVSDGRCSSRKAIAPSES